VVKDVSLDWALGLTHKHQTRLKMLARDKYSSLLQTLEQITQKKSFITLGPEV
jgi:hypothetical protein